MTREPVIDIVAGIVRDGQGRILLVRKRGTRAFMQPGGKRDNGEGDLSVLARELREELACRLVPGSPLRIGAFEAAAANEPGCRVRAQVYEVAVEGEIVPQSEIEEIAWVDPDAVGAIVLAPLTRDSILPHVRAARAEGS
jgi:8-oxo-dGTP diphosphatase